MMTRPKVLRIGAFKFKVRWDKGIDQFAAAGATNQDMTTILISPTNTRQTRQETLVHEALHAMWKQTPLRVTHPDEEADSPGEKIIQTISPLIYAFIRDNPEVIEWLQSP